VRIPIEGTGSFRAGDETNPYVGEKGKVHFENEIRFETIFPIWLQQSIVQALIAAHPYEEVAYDIYPLDNALEIQVPEWWAICLNRPMKRIFWLILKAIFGCCYIRHTALKEAMKR
jgi:hypothetical protein